MRRVILLALLALTLPTAALANSISDPACGPNPHFCAFNMTVFGDTANHSFTGGSFKGDIPNPMVPEGPFSRFVDIFPGPLTGVPLSNCPPDEQFGPYNLCFKFGGGTFTYHGFTGSGGSLILKSSLGGGFAGVEVSSIEGVPEGHSFITATILPGLGTTGGSVSARWVFIGHSIQSTPAGSLNLSIGLTPISEPGTLGLLGTGLFGLAGMARRKRKLET